MIVEIKYKVKRIGRHKQSAMCGLLLHDTHRNKSRYLVCVRNCSNIRGILSFFSASSTIRALISLSSSFVKSNKAAH